MGLMSLLPQVTSSSSSLPNFHLLFFSPAPSLQPLLKNGSWARNTFSSLLDDSSPNLGPLALLPFPSPGNLPNPRIEPRSPALRVDSLLSEPKLYKIRGFPGSTSGKESACQCRRHKYLGFDLWSDPGDWKDPLEKEVATHSSILAWEIPQTEEPGRLQSVGLQKSWTPLSTTAAIE